jgi:hypothetical protein
VRPGGGVSANVLGEKYEIGREEKREKDRKEKEEIQKINYKLKLNE